MERTKKMSDAREFFSGQIRSAMEKQRLSVETSSFDYLVDLLVRFMESENFFAKNADGRLEHNVLANLYEQYLNADPQTKAIILRRLGDVSLVVTGFFSDSLNRKLVDVDYYMGMGGSAYWNLAHLQWSGAMASLYKELSVKFKKVSDVLGEVSERSGLQSNTDLLRLYEKWLLTGSERLKKLLSEHGIRSPINIDAKIRH